MVAALLGFMAITGYAGMTNIKGIIPELLPPDELFADSPAAFRVLLRNTKKQIPSFLLQLTSTHNHTVMVPFINAGETFETTINLIFQQRGRNRVGEIRVSSPFPVNFFTRYWNFQLNTLYMVYPRLLPLNFSEGQDGSERTGFVARKIRGHDGELESIRGYSGNEPLRSVHWKLSARSEELLVKEFGSQLAPPLVIRPESLAGADIEEQISHAAWLVRQRVMVQPVGMVLGDQTIPPASGRRQCALLLTELALYGHV